MGTATSFLIWTALRFGVEAHFIIDGDCDAFSARFNDSSVVEAHSIIDGDCDQEF